MKATETVFQKLLDGKIQYVVPLYQRTYSWKKSNGASFGTICWTFMPCQPHGTIS